MKHVATNIWTRVLAAAEVVAAARALVIARRKMRAEAGEASARCVAHGPEYERLECAIDLYDANEPKSDTKADAT